MPATAAKRYKEKKQKQKKKTKRNKNEKPKVVARMVYHPKSQNFDLCICPGQKVVKHDSSGRQGGLLHFKGRFE